MRYRLLSIAILLLLLTQSVSAATATSSRPSSGILPADVCVDKVHERLAQEQRIYRNALFGRRKAEDEALGMTRYDKEGNAWIKMQRGKWVSQSKGYEGTTWADALMDAQTEWEEQDHPRADRRLAIRRGIFETKGAMTSELIPPILQSFRAFQCRALAVCQNVLLTYSNAKRDGDGLLDVSVPGCDVKMKPIDACAFADDETLKRQGNLGGSSIVKGYCEPLVQELLAREAALTKLAVAYDGAYRTLLQFAGLFDGFALKFRGDLLQPVQQSMSLLSQLSRLPCFLSVCNE